MALLLSIVEGWTEPLTFVLKVNGTAIDLTGLTIELILRTPAGTLITPGGTVEIDADQVTNIGQLTYTPVAADFSHHPLGAYQIHWKATNGSNEVIFFPNGDADTIAVYKA